MSAWTILIIAGVLEICWAIGMKYSHGFSKFGPTVFTLITMIASMLMLSRATATLPIGTAYAVWVGIGSAGAGILGIFLFEEPATPLRLLFIGLLIFSIIGLKFTSG